MFERLGSDPLKDEPADALGIELGLLAKSSGCFLVRDAHLFFTALSVLQVTAKFCHKSDLFHGPICGLDCSFALSAVDAGSYIPATNHLCNLCPFVAISPVPIQQQRIFLMQQRM